jgi:hypothetical protein
MRHRIYRFRGNKEREPVERDKEATSGKSEPADSVWLTPQKDGAHTMVDGPERHKIIICGIPDYHVGN